MIDVAALRRSFGAVAEHGDEVPLYFYSYLFLRHPHLRSMFPPGMAAQRGRLVEALATIVSEVDALDSLVPYLEHLGRDHRKFEVVAEHYPQVGEALLATLEHFLGAGWTPQLAKQWQEAYGLVSAVMTKAAAENGGPPWWSAEITHHERRGPDVAVIRVRPEQEVTYLPGQSLSLQLARRARLWRYYSPANAPRADHSLEFHVRAVDGGWVSPTLVFSAGPGDRIELGPAVGDLVLNTASADDILMIAGGTGLAPLRAMIEQLATSTRPQRQVHLYVEARTERDHYDLPALERLAASNPWLSVVPVARQGQVTRALGGSAADVALRQSRWSRHDVYVCGSQAMVAETRDLLLHGGVDADRIRHETFTYRPTSADDVNSPPDGPPLASPTTSPADAPPSSPIAVPIGSAHDVRPVTVPEPQTADRR